MILKDASAYNIQFLRGQAVLIDTLSFDFALEGKPWIAYGQFCRHFLAPLALMAYTDIRLNQLLKNWIDGIPIEFNRKVRTVTYTSKGAEIETSRGVFRAKTVVLAVPGAHYHAYGKAARPGPCAGSSCAATAEPPASAANSAPTTVEMRDFCSFMRAPGEANVAGP